MVRPVIHIILHIVAPGIAARFLRPGRWKLAWAAMLSAWLIDLDHLMADPIFDPDRCSLGFHPLHSCPAIALYLIVSIFPQTRLLGIGLLIHILLDGLDCLWMAV